MTILLLEDDVALNRAIKKITQLDGHTTTSYFDGADVAKTLRAKLLHNIVENILEEGYRINS